MFQRYFRLSCKCGCVGDRTTAIDHPLVYFVLPSTISLECQNQPRVLILLLYAFLGRVSFLSQVKNEGVGALYSGLSAALARQASYTTLRLGLYDLLKRLVLDRE